jgi:AraC family transcriptional activator of pobA
MPNPKTAIKTYSLFGEFQHLPDVIHCETIAERSSLHGWELAPHRHARLHQILLVERGGGEASLDDATVPLQRHQMVNVPPGHVHAFRFKEGTQGWVVTLADDLLDEICARVGDVRSAIGQAAVISANGEMRQLMQQIGNEYLGRSHARAMVLKGLATTLLGWLARSLTDAENTQNTNQEPELVKRFRALLQTHFAEQWGVSDYAHALSVSTTHLSRLTRAATGQSASQLIEARTLREARRYLAYTNLNVATIAYALGYSDPAYFTRVFTRDSGASPRVFRQQLK